MGIAVLSPDQVGDDTPDGKAARKQGLHERTSLRYYILKEAAVTQQGTRLGPPGSRIVAETFGDSAPGAAPSPRFGVDAAPVPGVR